MFGVRRQGEGAEEREWLQLQPVVPCRDAVRGWAYICCCACAELVSYLRALFSCSYALLVLQAAADTVKRVSLELGGNAPYIVFEDAGGWGMAQNECG